MSQAELPGEELELPSAVLDLSRTQRCGFPEVIFGEGKSAEELAAIVVELAKRQQPILATRVKPEQVEAAQRAVPALQHFARERCLKLGGMQRRGHEGDVVVVSAGTSDAGVAGEARIALEFFGYRPKMINDVGVAGLHRLLRRVEDLRRARVVIVVAGMEGALPSVVGGLVACPVIAVPVSAGYGVGEGGWAALAGMLTSCASGITVVNIDNGFGAAAAAHRILHAVQFGFQKA